VGFSGKAAPARAIDHTQAALFVDFFKYSGQTGDSLFWRGTVDLPDLGSLLTRFLGKTKTDVELAEFAQKHSINWIITQPPMPIWSAMPKNC
jgi:hypothetical protein